MTTYRRPVATVTINGRVYETTFFDTRHGVDQPVGTATLALPIEDFTNDDLQDSLNKQVDIRAGYDGVTATQFSGRVVNTDLYYDINGRVASIDCDGWCSLLAYPLEDDLVFGTGGFDSTSLFDITRSILEMRDVPNSLVDNITFVDTDLSIFPITVNLGGTPELHNGQVIIPSGTSPLSWLVQKLGLFGYRIFDTPQGVVRVMRVSGLPPAASTIAAAFTEGVNLYNARMIQSNREIINWWRVNGPRYVQSTGNLFQITSIPGVTPDDPDIDPPGYRASEIADEELVNTTLAKAVRHIKEIDEGHRSMNESFDTEGSNTLAPGDVVTVNAPTVNPAGGDTKRWMMSMAQSFGDSGYTLSAYTWHGAGEELPAGNDCTTQNLEFGTTKHFGDETISQYRTPAPIVATTDNPYVTSFTVASVFTTINFRALAHGSNWNRVRGGTDPKSLSRIEVWQSGARVGSADMPELQDIYVNGVLQSYADGVTGWTEIAIPLPGTLIAGTAEIHIICGEYEADVSGPYDEFELRNMRITTCGIGAP